MYMRKRLNPEVPCKNGLHPDLSKHSHLSEGGPEICTCIAFFLDSPAADNAFETCRQPLFYQQRVGKPILEKSGEAEWS